MNYTYRYTASYGKGKGQTRVTGTVEIQPTRNPELTAKNAAFADMRRRFPVAAQRRTIRVQSVMMTDPWPAEPSDPRLATSGDTTTQRADERGKK